MAITRAAQERQAALALRQAKREGGQLRWEEASPSEALAARRAAAAAVNGPVGLARRLVKRWPDATDAERAAVLDILHEAGIVPELFAPPVPWQEPG